MFCKIINLCILIFVGLVIRSSIAADEIMNDFDKNDVASSYDTESEGYLDEFYNPTHQMVFVSLINYLKSIRLHLPLNLFKKFNKIYYKHKQEIKRLRLANSIIDIYKHEVAKNAMDLNESNELNITKIKPLKTNHVIDFNKKIQLSDNIKKFIVDIVKQNSTAKGLFELSESFREIARAIKESRAQSWNNNITKWTCHCDPVEEEEAYSLTQDELFNFK